MPNLNDLVSGIGRMETGSLGYSGVGSPAPRAYSYVSPAGALGAYGFMPGTLAGVMPGVSQSQFLASPQLQDQAAATLAGQYYTRYGSVASIGQAWLGGPGSVGNTGVTDPYTGITTGQYGGRLTNLVGSDTIDMSDSGGGSGTIATGPPDVSSGDGINGTLTMDPADPNYGDITGYSVAGVNAPIGSDPAGSGVTSGQYQTWLSQQTGATPSTSSGTLTNSGVTPGASAATTSGTNAPNVSSSTPAGTGTPENVGLQPTTTQDITTWVNSITKAAGQGVTAAISAAETGLGTAFSGVQNWFIRAGLILLAIVLIAVGLIVLLWDHGGKETAGRIMEVAAA